MEELELFQEVIALYQSAYKNHSKIKSLLNYTFKNYPNLSEYFNLDEENKKITLINENLMLYTERGNSVINLLPKHYAAYLYNLNHNRNSDDYKYNAYKLMQTYMAIFADYTNGSRVINESSYSSFRSSLRVVYNMDPSLTLANGLVNLTRIVLELQEDYDAILLAEPIYNTYKELFNEVNPTGDYVGLVNLLASNHFTLERLEIVDGVIKDFNTISLNTGSIQIYNNQTLFKYVVEGSYDEDEGFSGDPNDLVDELSDKLDYIKELKEEAELVGQVIDMMHNINNVNYFIK
jgi:hypothetical protein